MPRLFSEKSRKDEKISIMLKVKIKSFEALTKHELYYLLQLRSEVFVVEQDCVYQDLDGKDEKALHVLGFKNEKLVAYTRIFKPGDYFENSSIGRVVVADAPVACCPRPALRLDMFSSFCLGSPSLCRTRAHQSNDHTKGTTNCRRPTRTRLQ